MRKLAYMITFMVLIGALALPFINADKEVDIKVIVKLTDKKMDKEAMQKQREKALHRGYKIKLKDYEKQYSYGPISYMNVEEITIFYQPNEEKREFLLHKAEEHIAGQIGIFEGYGEVQTKLLKKAFVEIKGDYVICIVSDQVQSISEAFTSLF